MPTLGGTLRDLNGRAIPGATVSIYTSAGVFVGTQTTDAAGAWTATVAAGHYSMIERKGADFRVVNRFVCADEPAGNPASRTVLDAQNRPVEAAEVWIRDGGGALVVVAGELNPRHTDARGQWASNLPPGTYAITYKRGGVTIATESLYICAEPVPDTFYLLAETGSVLLAETGSRFIYQ